MAFGNLQDLESEDGNPKPHLCFVLTHAELAALGLDNNPEVGDYLHACVLAEVSSVNRQRGPDDEDLVRIELEIKAMGLEDENHEQMDMEPADADVGDMLFGS